MSSHQFWNIRLIKHAGTTFDQESLQEFSELRVPIPCWPRDSERDRKGSTRNPVAPDLRISLHWFWWVAEPFKGDCSCSEWNDRKLKVFFHLSYKPKRQFFVFQTKRHGKEIIEFSPCHKLCYSWTDFSRLSFCRILFSRQCQKTILKKLDRPWQSRMVSGMVSILPHT